MSYEEEKQDRKIDQLGAEIERLRAELARVNHLRETEIDQAGAAERIYVEAARLKDVRIQEREDALVEATAWKLMEEHNEFSSIGGPKVKDLVDFLDDARQQLRAEGKIGNSEHFTDASKMIWQITDERKAALEHILICHHCRYDDSGCKAPDVLRAMLHEVGQE